jgi:hypothetical protein
MKNCGKSVPYRVAGYRVRISTRAMVLFSYEAMCLNLCQNGRDGPESTLEN